MKLFSKIIRAIERNSRQNERRKLVRELEDMHIGKQEDLPRVRQIIARMNELSRLDLDSYLNRDKPVKSVSQMIEEDDAALPEGLTGEWKAPV